MKLMGSIKGHFANNFKLVGNLVLRVKFMKNINQCWEASLNLSRIQALYAIHDAFHMNVVSIGMIAEII